MSQAVNVLDKAKAESFSDKNHEVFKRVESRYAKIGKAKIKASLDSYKEGAEGMMPAQLAREKHSSAKLGRFLRADGQRRPGARWEAHHIVSGNHKEAMTTRALLADEDIKVRIDDPDNGCWMPKTKADARPTVYPNAIGHNRIHRQLYYDWLFRAISVMQTDLQVRAFLNTVRAQLLHGNIRDEMKLQEEIDESEYNDWIKKNRKL